MTDVREPSTEERAMWLAKAAESTALAEAAKQLARKTAAEADLEELGVGVGEIDYDRAVYKRKLELTLNEHNHMYDFWGGVDESSVKTCVGTLRAWKRLNAAEAEKPPIEIAFYSPGGGVTAGMALFDYIQTVRRAGHFVTTSCIGQAASMGGILLQAGDRRVMNAESWLMIHEAAFGVQGKTANVDDMVKYVKRVQDRILDIFATRAANSGVDKPISRAAIKRNWTKTDWWIDSAEALKLGLVDEVL